AAGDRPAQPLRAGGDGRRRVPLRLDRPARGDPRGPAAGGGRTGPCRGDPVMSRAVITGGAGFLGSPLSEPALAEGQEVVCADNLLTGRLENLKPPLHRDDFQFREHDVSKPFEIEGPVDYILHFASPASPIDYLELPIQTLKVGSLGTHNSLGLAKAKG